MLWFSSKKKQPTPSARTRTYVEQMRFKHDALGFVEVKALEKARHVTARWRKGEVRVSVPVTMSERQVIEVIESMVPRLLAKRPEATPYRLSEVVALPHFSFVILRDERVKKGELKIKRDADNLVSVSIDPDSDLEEISPGITKHLIKFISRHYREHLLERGREIAHYLGLPVKEWKIGSGMRTLGTCSRDGKITLSHALLFLSQELSDFIILHELTHLTHHDHSPNFHALLNHYTGGREKELNRLLKNYHWPIMR